MPRNTTPQSRQATLERILHVAEQEFAGLGFEQANINTIASRADIGKGTIYLYFPSKRDLFLAMLRAIAERQLTVLKAALEHQPTLYQQIQALWLAFVGLAAENPDGFHVLMSALYGSNRAFQGEAIALLRDTVSLLGYMLGQQGGKRPSNLAEQEARALWVFSTTESLILSARVLGYSNQQLVDLTPMMAGLILSGLEGRTAR